MVFINKIINSFHSKPGIYQFLRFASIGFLNTALNFLVLNTVSKALNIEYGIYLGMVAIPAFLASVFQSYFWNRAWTFGNENNLSLPNKIFRLTIVGFIGLLTIFIIFAASKVAIFWEFYLILTIIFLIAEYAAWRAFKLHLPGTKHSNHSFTAYFFITGSGLIVNTFIISFISSTLSLTGTDMDKNIAALIASTASLIWNFGGYKKFVFKS